MHKHIINAFLLQLSLTRLFSFLLYFVLRILLLIYNPVPPLFHRFMIVIRASTHNHNQSINKLNILIQFSKQPLSNDMAEITKAKKHRNARRLICTKTIVDLTDHIVSNDKNTAAIRSAIDILQSRMAEMKKFDDVIHNHLDDDALLQDMEECEDRVRTIKIAIYKAQDYMDSVKSSDNSRSEMNFQNYII